MEEEDEEEKKQNGVRRQVIFANKPDMVQSEIMIVYKNNKKQVIEEH